MRIYAWHDESGCGFYRIRLPLGELAKHGHDVKMVLGSDVRVADAREYPLIVGQRTDKHDALPEWRRFRAKSKLVYEIDDDVFTTSPVNWMAHRVYSQPLPQDAVIHAVEVADLVTVTTEPLADVMRKHNPNVVVLPNYIPSELLQIERPRRDKLVVGWAGGASHGEDLQIVARPVRQFLNRNKHAELHIIGNDYRPTFRCDARFTDWDSDHFRYYRNIDFDIGLAPLTYSVFNRSKSHVKALEYAALGIPVLATDSEPYRDFVIDGVTGFLIRRDHEWGKRLQELANDEAMRTEMGVKAREHAAQWTIERNWKLWADAYEGLVT